jgi:hypothetical protein
MGGLLMALFKRQTEEDKELKLAKQKVKAQQVAFKQLQALNRTKAREEIAHQRAERENILTAQRITLAQATAESRAARQARSQAEEQLRQQRIASIKQTVTSTVQAVKPYVAPVKTVYNAGKTVLTTVAHSGIEKSYVMGFTNGNSPSYTVLMHAFEGQPFTPSQAVQVLASARGISYEDAFNRLRQMKQLGMIKEEGV